MAYLRKESRNVMPLKSSPPKKPIPIYTLKKENFEPWVKTQSLFIQNWIQTSEFSPSERSCFHLPDSDGNLTGILFITSHNPTLWDFSTLSAMLPKSFSYVFSDFSKDIDSLKIAIGIELGSYSFSCFKTKKPNSRYIQDLKITAIPLWMGRRIFVR